MILFEVLVLKFTPFCRVEFGREFHADLFRKLSVNNDLLLQGEALRAPCYTAIKRPAKRHYLSDASFDVVDVFCVERKAFWRDDLPKELTTELKRNAELGGT